MSYSLVILERAQEEIDEAYEYYSEISYGVMKSFDHQLEQVSILGNKSFFSVSI